MKRFSIFLILFFLIGGCAGTRGPSERFDPLSQTLRHEALESLKRRNESLKGLRGMATVRYGSKLFGARGETAFALQRPTRLRIDGLSDFGLYSSQLALKDGGVVILWPTDNVYFQGEATPEVMRRYLLVQLPPNKIIEILLGVIPLEDEEVYRVSVLHKGRQLLLRGRIGEVIVEPNQGAYLPIQYTSYDGEGEKRYQVSYSEYEQGTGVPGRLSARFWDPHARIEVQYKELEVNPAFDKAVFQIRVPREARRVEY